MAALTGVILEQEHALRKKRDVDLNFKKFLLANPPQPGFPHIDLQIQEAVEELRRLKAEHVELRTKELFMKTILNAKSLDDLPTSQETGRAEVALQEAKRGLRKVKAERGKAEEDLVAVVEEIGSSLREQNTARDEAQLRLRQARSAFKSADVCQVLNRRDVSQIESLVEDIDELDASTCRDVISILREERTLMERKANQQSSLVENVRQEVEELETDVRNMTLERNRLKLTIAEEDQRNPTVAKLRHECMLQKELESILASLTGVRVSEIREHGISFGLNAALFVPFSCSLDRSKSTHKLDIEFAEEHGDQSLISRMSIRPADINVADLCNDGDTALCVAMPIICSRLADFLSQKELA